MRQNTRVWWPMKLVRSWLSTASENQIREYGARIANAAGESVLTEFASAVERIGNSLTTAQSLQTFSGTQSPEFGVWHGFSAPG